MTEEKEPAQRTYTTDQVARILGVKVYTVREWARSGKIPPTDLFKVMGRNTQWRISKRWVDSQTGVTGGSEAGE